MGESVDQPKDRRRTEGPRPSPGMGPRPGPGSGPGPGPGSAAEADSRRAGEASRRRFLIVAAAMLMAYLVYQVWWMWLVPAWYPLATTRPPEDWSVEAEWVRASLEELVGRAHIVALVDVVATTERWISGGVEWSSYNASVRRYVLDRTGAGARSLTLVQAGGGREIYLDFPALEPGRSYVLVLTRGEAGGRLAENLVSHPAAIYPLVSEKAVEAWWPAPPFDRRSPSAYMSLERLIREIEELGR